MKKRIGLMVLVLAFALVLAACGCEHEWTDADCENPKTCSLCDETEGEALGHTWADATCEAPKTCAVCAATEGEALGHTWVDATTEEPKTCSVCAATEGERIITDERFTTAACQDLFGTWHCEMVNDGEAELGMTIDGVDMNYISYVDITFTNDGAMIVSTAFEEESFFRVLRAYTIELMYVSLEQQGIGRDQADEAMVTTYGMDVAGYVDASMAVMSIDDYAEESTGVYYVADGTLYSAEDWDEEMGIDTITLSGDSLTLTGADGIVVELTRVTE